VKIKKFNWLLVLLLLISFFIRIYKIDNLSLFGDEIDVGYQAFSLLQTGRDYKGNFLPFYIQSLSESRAPLLIYLTIPGIKIFGLTELGVRITPIIFGVLSIYLLYKLVFLLSNSNTLALYSSLALSLSPWHFHYSRAAFEVTLLLSLILAGTYFAYKFINSSKNKFLYLSILSFCLSFYTYNTANIFVPLLISTIFFTNLKSFLSSIKLKNFIISLLLFLVLTLPLIYQIFLGSAANRFNLISIFHNQNTINQIIDKRTTFSAVSPQVEAIFHNKPIAWIGEFAKNYLSAFSLPFLFISGDQTNYRHSIPNFGLIFIAFLPVLLTGLFKLNFKDKLNKLMFGWLLFSPIASSFTISGGNHATRLFLMTLPLAYFSALGIFNIIKNNNIFSKFLLFLSFLLLFIQIIGFTHEYFIHYPKDSFEVWNYGYKELFQSIPETTKNIFISNAKYNSLLPFSFYQQRSLDNGFLNDTPQKNINNNFSGFYSNSTTFFITDFNQADHLDKINQIAQTGDIFLLFQDYDIPGDMNFSLKPLAGFKTITTIYNPNQTILGQVIQKL
jgi:4-amino-4-deoxy-L-arabinose transferase-like glycosyltransferase